jgi:outer membrane lipoprotein LolB
VQTEYEGGSFDLFWQQHGAVYTVRLIAPLGQGTVLIHGDDDGVSIRTTDGRTRYSNDPDALFAEMTGISLPVSALREWLRGLPVTDALIEQASWDEAGRLYRLDQLDWRIEMTRYQAYADYMLPQAFYLEHNIQQDLNVRLIVRQWKIPPSTAGEVAS